MLRAAHYIGELLTEEEIKMRGILKAMLVAYIMKKVKNKLTGRGSHRKVYRA
jgi:hypothetical protein